MTHMLPPPSPGDDMYAADRRIPEAALEHFLNDSSALVIAHVHTGDWRAHEAPVGAPDYVAEFRRINAVADGWRRRCRPGAPTW